MKAPSGMYFNCPHCGYESSECNDLLVSEDGAGKWTPVCGNCNSRVWLFDYSWTKEHKDNMIAILK